MPNKWILVSAIMGGLAVALGAFGAHGLKKVLTTEQIQTFEVGVRYQMYHALALLGVAWVIGTIPSRWANASAICMLVGVVLFSGSIYGLVLAKWRWLGPITPIGGVVLMTGWFCLAMASLRAWPKT